MYQYVLYIARLMSVYKLYNLVNEKIITNNQQIVFFAINMLYCYMSPIKRPSNWLKLSFTGCDSS